MTTSECPWSEWRGSRWFCKETEDPCVFSSPCSEKCDIYGEHHYIEEIPFDGDPMEALIKIMEEKCIQKSPCSYLCDIYEKR